MFYFSGSPMDPGPVSREYRLCSGALQEIPTVTRGLITLPKDRTGTEYQTRGH